MKPPRAGLAASRIAIRASTIEAASVSMCAASEIRASELAANPTTTSTAMNRTIRVSALVSQRRSASAATACEWL